MSHDLHRQPWIPGPAFVCYGARIAVRANIRSALEGVAQRLPRPRRSSTAQPDWVYSIVARDGRFSLYRGDESLSQAVPLGAIHALLESDVHGYVARAARGKLFVHAGVVGWRGVAIAVPGRTMSGKSSMIAALVRAGADYYSDEYAVLDRAGLVHPYPKPLSIRQPNRAAPVQQTAADLGGGPGTSPLPLGLVLSTRYRKGARWRPTRLTEADGLMVLFANTVLARVRPRFALSVLRHTVADCHAIQTDRSEADRVAPAILRMTSAIARTRHRS